MGVEYVKELRIGQQVLAKKTDDAPYKNYFVKSINDWTKKVGVVNHRNENYMELTANLIETTV